MSDTADDIKKYLAGEFGMDDAEIDEMLSMFSESLTRLLDDIEDCIASGDAGRLKDAGHTLKGVAANIGAEQIASLGKDIEEIGKTGQPEQAAGQLAELKIALDTLTQSN